MMSGYRGDQIRQKECSAGESAGLSVDRRGAEKGAGGRFLALLVLVVLEIEALTVSYSTMSLEGQFGLWVKLVGSTSRILPLAFTVVAATILLGGHTAYREIRRELEHPQPWPRAIRFLVCHLLLFLVFALLTDFVFKGMPGSPLHPLFWVLLWGTTGLAAFLSWCLVSLPRAGWFRLTGRCRSVLLIGGAAGGAAYVAGLLTEQLWDPLAQYTFWTVRWILRPFFSDLTGDLDTLTLGTSLFSVRIAPRCSGYEGIGLVATFLATYFWFFRRSLRFPRVFLLLPAGIVAIWLTNSLRIAALIAIGISFSPGVAIGGFHQNSGWLAFNAVALGLIAGAERLAFFSRNAAAPSQSSLRENPIAAYLAPLLVTVGVGMAAASFSTEFEWLYPLRVIAAVGTLYFFRKAYAKLQWTWSWQAIALGVLPFVIWLVLARSEPTLQQATQVGLAGLPIGLAAAWLFFRAFGYVITVPIVEELAFRGYLARRLISASFQTIPAGQMSWYSLVVSSALFGLMHGQNWLPGTLAGLFYAWALQRRGAIADSVQAHATTNALLLVYALATGDWSKWS